MYIPPPARLSLLHSIHSSPLSGHLGRFCTKALIERDFWWPGLSVFVHNFVAGCAVCQQNTARTHPVVPPLSPIKSSSSLPFKQLSIDLITDLPLSHGHDSLMVVVDHGLTKGVILAPCSKTIDANGIAQLFFDYVFKRFGLHDILISDRGPQFASAFTRELARLLKYDVCLSTAYHPQTDGQTERTNKKSKLISISSVPTILTNGLSFLLLPNSSTTLFPIALQRSPPSLSSSDMTLACTLLLARCSSLPSKTVFPP